MKLREYGYFKLADEDFKRASDAENIYRISEICEDGCVEARNVVTEEKRTFDAETTERATRVIPTDIEQVFVGNRIKPKKYKLPTIITTEPVKEWTSAEPAKTDDVDMINKPPHYTHGMECIDEMILIFGVEAVKNFCKLNVWKYRKRAMYKDGERDMQKSDCYMKKLKELESKK